MPRWLFYTLITVLLWGLWGVASKLASTRLPAWQLQVISLVGVVPVIGILWRLVRDQPRPTNGRFLFASLAAGLLGCVGNLAYFHALSSGGKAVAVTPLTSLYPITTILLAMVFLRERPTTLQTIGLLLSLLAIWLFNVSDESGLISSWLLFALIPIVCWGIGGFIQKLSTSSITGEQCALAFLLGFMPMALIALVQDGQWSEVSLAEWFWGILAGLFFAVGNLTVILAYGSGGRAVIVTPIASLYMLVTIPLAVAFLGETLRGREGWAVVAAILAVISLCYEPAPTTSVVET